MKKKTLKLTLRKETVSILSKHQHGTVNGGGPTGLSQAYQCNYPSIDAACNTTVVDNLSIAFGCTQNVACNTVKICFDSLEVKCGANTKLCHSVATSATDPVC